MKNDLCVGCGFLRDKKLRKFCYYKNKTKDCPCIECLIKPACSKQCQKRFELVHGEIINGSNHRKGPML
jgi:hypothetical protein